MLALQRESAQKEALGEPAYAASDYFKLTFETVKANLTLTLTLTLTTNPNPNHQP